MTFALIFFFLFPWSALNRPTLHNHFIELFFFFFLLQRGVDVCRLALVLCRKQITAIFPLPYLPSSHMRKSGYLASIRLIANSMLIRVPELCTSRARPKKKKKKINKRGVMSLNGSQLSYAQVTRLPLLESSCRRIRLKP